MTKKKTMLDLVLFFFFFLVAPLDITFDDIFLFWILFTGFVIRFLYCWNFSRFVLLIFFFFLLFFICIFFFIDKALDMLSMSLGRTKEIALDIGHEADGISYILLVSFLHWSLVFAFARTGFSSSSFSLHMYISIYSCLLAFLFVSSVCGPKVSTNRISCMSLVHVGLLDDITHHTSKTSARIRHSTDLVQRVGLKEVCSFVSSPFVVPFFWGQDKHYVSNRFISVMFSSL